jgi:hypothetical protein
VLTNNEVFLNISCNICSICYEITVIWIISVLLFIRPVFYTEFILNMYANMSEVFLILCVCTSCF